MPPVESAPTVPPAFGMGFAALQTLLGDRMGVPTSEEYTQPETGDILQDTSTGLCIYRASTNVPSFTDGYAHWALTEAGLVSWTGPSTDPRADPE